MGTASVGTLIDTAVGVQVIIAAVLGGRRTIVGAALGAVFLIAAGELLRPLGPLSTFVVSAVALLVHPVRAFGAARPRIRPESAMTVAVRPAPPRAASLAEPCLTVRGLTKRSAAWSRSRTSTSTCDPGDPGSDRAERLGQVHRDEADHGAGAAHRRSIRLDGAEIGGLPAHRVARQGVGLVFQHARPLQRRPCWRISASPSCPTA